ncbi:MAG TPA: four helix bundle protein [Candidatus Sulfotelmatobacter sp.]|nr:four helix bundle protein [Candidatus Sulfotelmatobacter sp.]
MAANFFARALPRGQTIAPRAAKSNADFISKMGTVEEELDESVYWLEMLRDSGNISADGARSLIQEADELLAITVSSINTARGGKR